jgi:F-type H+-transporting ATPase subunit delta
MARTTAAARRYAEAAFQLAVAEGALDRWRDELALAAALAGDERALRVLASPVVPMTDRRATLERLLGGRVTPTVHNLVSLLTVRGRIDILPAVSAEYDRLLDRERGIVRATVISAQPLSPDEVTAVQARVEAMTGAQVRLEAAVDPALIGGLTVQVGDRLLDASVRGRLERLRSQLMAGRPGGPIGAGA